MKETRTHIEESENSLLSRDRCAVCSDVMLQLQQRQGHQDGCLFVFLVETTAHNKVVFDEQGCMLAS